MKGGLVVVRKDVMSHLLMSKSVYVAVPAPGQSYGVLEPRPYKVRCVGSAYAILDGHRDTAFEFCYPTRAACIERCRDLYNIYTMQDREKYPLDPRAA